MSPGKRLLQAENAYSSRDIYLQRSQNHTEVRLAGDSVKSRCGRWMRTADAGRTRKDRKKKIIEVKDMKNSKLIIENVRL